MILNEFFNLPQVFEKDMEEGIFDKKKPAEPFEFYLDGCDPHAVKKYLLNKFGSQGWRVAGPGAGASRVFVAMSPELYPTGNEAKWDIESNCGEQGVAEGLPQTLRKVVPGYAKREIDKKMDAGKFGKTDADKDANFQRYKKIQDKLKEQGVAEDRLDELSPKTLGSYINKATKDAGTLGYGLGDINARPGKYKDSPDVVKDVKHSFNNRIKGVEKASHRLTKEQGVAEGHADQQRKVFKKNGHPVGEVGIDRESSPGNGQWYMKYYATGDDFSGYDSMEEAVADLKHLVNQFKAEGVAEAKDDYVPPKEADYGPEYQAMVRRVGEKARAQEKAKQQQPKAPVRESRKALLKQIIQS